MPARSAIEQLPAEVRDELDRRLVQSGFAGYVGLAIWLREQGFDISKSAVHRYGEKFEERASALKLATDQARAIVANSPDDTGAMNEALIRLVQERLFKVLIEMEVDPSKINLGSLTKGIATLARASVKQKEFEQEVRARASAAAEAVEKIARKGGLSSDAVDTIRREILGIPQ